jgi:O-antigen/teichoic acid export membrane protein
MASIKDLSKDTLIYGVGTVIQKIIGLFLLPFFTRALLPAQYGVLDTLATLTFFLSTVFGLGLGGATTRYFFIAEGEDEKKKLLYTSATIRLISYSIPVFFLVIFSSEISEMLFDTEQYSLVIIATGFLLFFLSQQEFQAFIFRYYREPVKFTFVIILRAIFNPVFGILFVVVLQWGVLGATLANLITSAFTLTFAYFYFTKDKYIHQFSYVWAKKLLKFGFPLILFSVLSWINSVSDRLFLLHYQDLKQIGLYSIGNTFSQPILLVNMALQMSSSVLIYSLYGEEKSDDKPKTKLFLTKIWHTYLGIAVIIASIVSIFSFDLVSVITTPKYIESILTIPFLLFSNILYMGTQMTGNGMTLKEQSKPYVWIMLIAAGTNFGLNFYFVPKFGFVGAAITTIISNTVNFLISYYWSQKVFYIKRSLIKPAIYFMIVFSISIFFPFYELKIGVHIPYLIKTAVLITVFILPFVFKFIDFNLIINLFNNIRQKINL